VDWYADQILRAISIKWGNNTGYWVEHSTIDDFGAKDADVEIGKGYEIYSGDCYFTFCGSPAANIRYLEGQLPKPENFAIDVNQITGVVTLSWDHVTHPDFDRYLIYKTPSRLGFRNLSISHYDATISNIWADPQPIGDDEEWFYAVTAVNISATVGYNSTYTIGVTNIYLNHGYHTFGLPNKPLTINCMDWYCGEISENWGMNYFIIKDQRWSWHKSIMPKGAFDPDVLMAEGYQISTNGSTKYYFVGI
jgi:hypothetical protein